MTTKKNKQDHQKTMRKEMQQIMDHAAALVDATSGELDDRVKAARDALNERIELAKSEYGDLEDQLLQKVQAVDEYIHAKPYHTSGVTFIAGLFLGWFLTRK